MNKWELSYTAPRGLRTNRGFTSVTVITSNRSHWWWCQEKGRWITHEEDFNDRRTSHHDLCDGAPKTKKAFARYLRKHPELKGETVMLVNRCYELDGGEPVSIDILATYSE